MKPKRPDWDSYFMEIADIVSKRSTCIRRSVGALIVKNKQILATGYNGAPSGLKHCMEVGCVRDQMGIASGERHELCRGLHAEQNAIIQAAYHGVTINGAHLYCTHLPCSICIKMLINSGIKKVFYLEGYPDDLSMKMIDESSILIEKVDFQKQAKKTSPKSTKESPLRDIPIKRKTRKGPRKA